MHGPTGFQCAHLAEQGALDLDHHAAQHVTAATTLRFLRRLNGGLEALECIELGKFGANGIARTGNNTQTAPCCIYGMEHFVDGSNGDLIAFGRNATCVGNLYLGAAFMELAHDHGNA